MASRLELQAELEKVLGSKNVWFQPSASVTLSYPCVVYSIGSGDAKSANDRTYQFRNSYEITFIFKRPMVEIIEKVVTHFPMCRCNTTFINDNLYHYVFTLYY